LKLAVVASCIKAILKR